MTVTDLAQLLRRPLPLAVAVAAGYALGSQLSYSWFGADGTSASFFPAAGVTLAALVLAARRLWPVVLAAAAVAEIAIDLAHGIGLGASAGYAVANTVQPLVGALAVGRLAPRIDLARVRDLVAFIACAVVAAPAVGGAIGASAFTLLDDGGAWGRFALEWWVGDGLGVLAVGGAILSLRSRRSGRAGSSRRREGVALGAACALSTVALFWLGWLALAYVPIALLIACGFRIGTRGVAVIGALVAVISAQATADGHSYWDALDIEPSTALLYLQIALGLVIVSALGVAAEVSERERAALGWASAERFRELADAAPAMLWVTDRRNACTFLSQGWYEHTGVRPDDDPDRAWAEALHPDDRPRALEVFHRAAARREPFALDYRLHRAGGGWGWVLDSGRPRLATDGRWLGYVGSVIDVDERERAQAALRESEARLRTLFSSIDEGYCLCEIVRDAEGRAVDYRFLEANPLFGAMTGLDDPVGRTAMALIPGLESHWVETYARVAEGDEPMRFQSDSAAMGRSFDVFAMPVAPRGRFALVFKDVTEQRAAERAVRERETAERRGRRRAELTTQVIGELEGIDGVAARAHRLLGALVPRVADFATVELPWADEPVVALAHRDPDVLPALAAMRTRHRVAPEHPDSVARVAEGDGRLVARVEAGGPGALWAGSGGDDVLARLAPRSHLAVPLDLGGGERAALLLFLSDPGRRPYDDDDLGFVRGLAERAGVLLARARVQEEEHRTALRLQRALLPDPIEPRPGIEIAARYAPAGEVLEVGGDWYDAFTLPDGRIGVAVGDVVGHGLEAAADMGGLRIALAALAPHAGGPGHLLSLLHDFARGPDGTDFATVCYGVLEPRSGRLTYSSAGHPPMLLVAPDGRTSWLDQGRAVPLCRMDVGARPEAVATMEPGSLLVLYSDGLVERRRVPLAHGLSRLEQIVREHRGAHVEEICDRVMDEMTADAPQDDTVILCLRFAPVAGERFHRVFPARPRELAPARADLRRWLGRIAPEADAVALLLAVGEACANAVEHAYLDREPGEVEVEVVADDGDELRVTVRDFGTWRTVAAEGPRGWGTGIMRSVGRDMARHTDDGGTTVTFRLPAAGAATGANGRAPTSRGAESAREGG